MDIHATLGESPRGDSLCRLGAARPTASPNMWDKVTCLACKLKINDPVIRYEACCSAMEDARDTYERYWVSKFAAEGITFSIKNGWSSEAELDVYTLRLDVRPQRYAGAVIEVHIKGAHPLRSWFTVKVKSESGFQKLIRKLRGHQYL